MRKLILIFLFPIAILSAQTSIHLDSCYWWARQNYPLLQQAGIIKQITGLKQDNLKTSWLPQVALHGQVTYQSDVPSIIIPMPGISIPSVSKDQYKVYTEIRQTIWDGGLSKTSEQFEEALLISSLNQLEMELYKLNEQVSMSFYTASLTEAQLDVIKAQKKTALENRKAIESGIKNGVMEKSAILALDAELLGIEQIEHQFVSIQRTAFNTLSILTGKNIENGMKLEITDRILKSSDGAQRHEYQFFASQNAQLGVQGELLKRSRYPKIFGFGQAGYGKPGLNMLNDKFDAFYLVGIGVSWNAFDWKKTYRQQQILELQSKDIGFRKDSFTQTLKILLDQQVQQIKKMDELIVKDYQIIHLRNEITKAAESKSRNGVLTTSEFIRELQNETVAKLNLELHKIQLLEAKEKYNILIGGIKF